MFIANIVKNEEIIAGINLAETLQNVSTHFFLKFIVRDQNDGVRKKEIEFMHKNKNGVKPTI